MNLKNNFLLSHVEFTQLNCQANPALWTQLQITLFYRKFINKYIPVSELNMAFSGTEVMDHVFLSYLARTSCFTPMLSYYCAI